jgi:hypothetical protein
LGIEGAVARSSPVLLEWFLLVGEAWASWTLTNKLANGALIRDITRLNSSIFQ